MKRQEITYCRTIAPVTHFRKTSTHEHIADIKAELDADISEQYQYKIISSFVISREYYAAVETTDENGNTIIMAILANMSIHAEYEPSCTISYSVVSEFEHPQYCRCPLKILDLLSDTDDPGALQWRRKCRDMHYKISSRVHTRNKVKKFRSAREGATVEGDWKGVHIILCKENADENVWIVVNDCKYKGGRMYSGRIPPEFEFCPQIKTRKFNDGDKDEQ